MLVFFEVGIGVGFVFSWEFVWLYYGCIELESWEGEGVIFWVFLLLGSGYLWVEEWVEVFVELVIVFVVLL